MSGQTFTPGPWQVRQYPHSGRRAIIGGYHIPPGAPAVMGGFLHVCDLSGDEHHDKANARLIAAAPELLEACQLAMEEFNDRYDGAPDAGYKWMAHLMQKMERALTKATGGQP